MASGLSGQLAVPESSQGGEGDVGHKHMIYIFLRFLYTVHTHML